MQDWLQVRAMCHAVANFLLSDGTPAPLAIAFQGPWGKGKSTVMKLVEKSLRILPLLRIEWDRPREDAAVNESTTPALGTMENVKLVQKASPAFHKKWGGYLKVCDEMEKKFEAVAGFALPSPAASRRWPNWLPGVQGKGQSRSKRLLLKLQHDDTMTDLDVLDRLFDPLDKANSGRSADGAKKMRATKLQREALEEAARTVVLPVRFNAWLYRDSKEIWAGIFGISQKCKLGTDIRRPV
jgi:hypothetical protein